jgi:hypothetical protein
MKDRVLIIVGIIIFAFLFTIPFWMNLSSRAELKQPELIYPEGETNCIAEKEYIKANHMDILNRWRDSVVRENVRFTVINGEKVEMSLSKTCMRCHSNKETFCDRCHNYLGVDPYCWNCHIAPKEVRQ